MNDAIIKQMASMEPAALKALLRKAKARTPEERALASELTRKRYANTMKSAYVKGTRPKDNYR